MFFSRKGLPNGLEWVVLDDGSSHAQYQAFAVQYSSSSGAFTLHCGLVSQNIHRQKQSKPFGFAVNEPREAVVISLTWSKGDSAPTSCTRLHTICATRKVSLDDFAETNSDRSLTIMKAISAYIAQCQERLQVPGYIFQDEGEFKIRATFLVAVNLAVTHGFLSKGRPVIFFNCSPEGDVWYGAFSEVHPVMGAVPYAPVTHMNRREDIANLKVLVAMFKKKPSVLLADLERITVTVNLAIHAPNQYCSHSSLKKIRKGGVGLASPTVGQMFNFSMRSAYQILFGDAPQDLPEKKVLVERIVKSMVENQGFAGQVLEMFCRNKGVRYSVNVVNPHDAMWLQRWSATVAVTYRGQEYFASWQGPFKAATIDRARLNLVILLSGVKALLPEGFLYSDDERCMRDNVKQIDSLLEKEEKKDLSYLLSRGSFGWALDYLSDDMGVRPPRLIKTPSHSWERRYVIKAVWEDMEEEVEVTAKNRRNATILAFQRLLISFLEHSPL